jgi:hypothetical protein
MDLDEQNEQQKIMPNHVEMGGGGGRQQQKRIKKIGKGMAISPVVEEAEEDDIGIGTTSATTTISMGGRGVTEL